MAEIVRRKSWGGVLPLGRHASIRGSSFIQCASVSIALSSVQEGQTARHHKQFKLEQALMSSKPRPADNLPQLVAGKRTVTTVPAPPSLGLMSSVPPIWSAME